MALACLTLPSLLLAREPVPTPVSPVGDRSAPAETGTCPTLSWSGIPEAEGYRVRILSSGEGRTVVLHEAEAADGRAWTPTTCLQPETEYAWQVQAIQRGVDGEWSVPQSFHAVEENSLEAALETAADRLVADHRLTDEERDWLRQLGVVRSYGDITIPPQTPDPLHDLQSPFTRSHSTGDASVHVEGVIAGVVVSSATEYGIYAEAAGGAEAIIGRATSSTGQNRGVAGVNNKIPGPSSPSRGVKGTSNSIGVLGRSLAPLGRAVSGRVTTGGMNAVNQGALGESASSSGKGAHGRATGFFPMETSYGVYAKAASPGVDYLADGDGSDYGPFTGAHLVRIEAGSEEIPPGMVVSVTGRAEALTAADGSIHLSSTLPTIRLATAPEDPAVLGAFVAEVTVDPDDGWPVGQGRRFGAVNAVGEGRIWTTDLNGPVAAGDYLTSSELPGYAQRQADSVLRAHTVAKAVETVDWSRVSETVVHRGRRVKVALIAVVYTGG